MNNIHLSQLQRCSKWIINLLFLDLVYNKKPSENKNDNCTMIECVNGMDIERTMVGFIVCNDENAHSMRFECVYVLNGFEVSVV